MRRKTSLLLILALVSVPACQNQRASYRASERMFRGMVRDLNEDIQSGRMSKARAQRFKPAVNAGNEGLKAWSEILLATPEGQEPDVPNSVINAVLSAISVLEAWVLSERK